jgi:serine phosphatase RsbU (regulator of sigma subunit)
MSNPEWLPSEVALPGSWTLMLYTDGLVEGRATPGGSERFGPLRLRDWFAARGNTAVDDGTLQALIAVVDGANGGTLPDDVAVLALTRLPPPTRSAGHSQY